MPENPLKRDNAPSINHKVSGKAVTQCVRSQAETGTAAPRSPVNNCGKLTESKAQVMKPTSFEYADMMLNPVDDSIYLFE